MVTWHGSEESILRSKILSVPVIYEFQFRFFNSDRSFSASDQGGIDCAWNQLCHLLGFGEVAWLHFTFFNSKFQATNCSRRLPLRFSSTRHSKFSTVTWQNERERRKKWKSSIFRRKCEKSANTSSWTWKAVNSSNRQWSTFCEKKSSSDRVISCWYPNLPLLQVKIHGCLVLA